MQQRLPNSIRRVDDTKCEVQGSCNIGMPIEINNTDGNVWERGNDVLNRRPNALNGVRVYNTEIRKGENTLLRARPSKMKLALKEKRMATGMYEIMQRMKGKAATPVSAERPAVKTRMMPTPIGTK